MANTNRGIYNAPQELGWPKTVVLGLQHVFAMFGATVIVPIITGLNVQVTLFCAGIGTLLFHFITKRKAPVFLGLFLRVPRRFRGCQGTAADQFRRRCADGG